MKTFTEFLLEAKGKSKGKVIAYHLSNQLEHMLRADFRMEYSSCIYKSYTSQQAIEYL